LVSISPFIGAFDHTYTVHYYRINSLKVLCLNTVTYCKMQEASVYGVCGIWYTKCRINYCNSVGAGVRSTAKMKEGNIVPAIRKSKGKERKECNGKVTLC